MLVAQLISPAVLSTEIVLVERFKICGATSQCHLLMLCKELYASTENVASMMNNPAFFHFVLVEELMINAQQSEVKQRILGVVSKWMKIKTTFLAMKHHVQLIAHILTAQLDSGPILAPVSKIQHHSPQMLKFLLVKPRRGAWNKEQDYISQEAQEA